MTRPAPDQDLALSKLLDQALSEIRDTGALDRAAWRSRYPEQAGDLFRLLDTARALDTAVSQVRTSAGDGLFAEGEEPPPPALDRYRIVGRAGAGGMGTVYKAFDSQLQRDVALKVLRLGGPTAAKEQSRNRFLREARAAAAVRHTRVCPLYDLGEAGGTPYVVMAFVEGESLADRLERGRFDDCREAASLACQVCEAVEAIHAHGIVHRDLKPGNVLLDASGDALLTDFGLAQLLEQGSERLTADGAILGTPAYMAPEQASLSEGPVGPAADIYSLGVVLYHMLAGRPPFQGPPLSIIYKVAQEAAPPASAFRPDLDPALAAIVGKAMARRPADRYRSAGELRAALLEWMAGRENRPRRLAWVAAAIALLAVGAALALVVVSVKTKHGTLVVKVSDPDAKVEIDGEGVVLDAKGLGRVTLTPGEHIVTMKRGDVVVETRTAKLTAGGETVEVDFRPAKPDKAKPNGTAMAPAIDAKSVGWRPRGLVDVIGDPRWRTGKLPYFSMAHTPALTFAEDGKTVIAMQADAIGGGWFPDRPVYFWDAATGAEVATLRYPKILHVAYSPDGRTCGVVHGEPFDFTFVVFDTLTRKERLRYRGSQLPQGGPCLSAGGKFAFLGSREWCPVWNLETGKERGPIGFPVGAGAASLLAVSADGKTMVQGVTTAKGTEVHVLDIDVKPGGQSRTVLEGVPFDFNNRGWAGASLSDDGRFVAVNAFFVENRAVWNHRYGVHDAATGKRLPAWKHGVENAAQFVFAPGGKAVAVHTEDGAVRLHDIATAKVLATLRQPGGNTGVFKMVFSPDGSRLAMSGPEPIGILLVDTKTGKLLGGADGEGVQLEAVSADGSTLALRVGAAIRIRDLTTGKDRCEFDVPPGQIIGPGALSPDGRSFAAPVNLVTVVWDVSGAAAKRVPVGGDYGVGQLAFTRDGGRLVVLTRTSLAARDMKEGKWSTHTFSKPLFQSGHGFLTLSPDGRSAFVCGHLRTLPIDLARGKETIAPEKPHPQAVFSADSRRVYRFGGEVGSNVIAWDHAGGKETTIDLPGTVALVAPPDGSLIAADGQGRVARWADGKVATLWQGPWPVLKLALSADGRHLFAGNSNRTVYRISLQ